MTDTLILGLAVALIGSGGIGAVVSTWIGKRGSRENTLIDQLQEMVDAGTKREVVAKDQAIESQRREASLLNYVWTLQRHINSGQPPPPPQWPDDLIAR